MVNYQIVMFPIILARAWLGIGPREVLHNPRCAHLTDHFKGTFDFPWFHFVGETGMDTDFRIAGLDGTLGAKRDIDNIVIVKLLTNPPKA